VKRATLVQHLALACVDDPINGNRMLFVQLATKRSSTKRSKIFFGEFRAKTKTPLVGAAFIIVEGVGRIKPSP
jgi:hypothetical protein